MSSTFSKKFQKFSIVLLHACKVFPSFDPEKFKFFLNFADKPYRMTRLLSQGDLANILDSDYTAILRLVNTGKIPYKKIGDNVQFCPDAIKKWMRGKPKLKVDDKKYLERYKKQLHEANPEFIKEIKEFSDQFTDPWEPRLFYLDKRPNKKLGFIIYVRYLVDGKMIPSHWCTHTNNEEEAEKFAIENRGRILKAYYEKKENKRQFSFLKVFREYYAENSPYLQIDAKRGRELKDEARGAYHNFITKQFVPYLKKQKIKDIEEIDTPFLARFQNYLLSDTPKKPGIKPQTINHYISHISQMFDHLLLIGNIKTNPCKSLICLKIKKEDLKATGCYDVEKIKGVFNKRWENELSYLLCMIIYTTNMRNSEIENMRVKDIDLMDSYYFIDIPEGETTNDKRKTENAVRKVPLHNFVYRKIMSYVKKNKKGPDDYIFKSPKSKKLGSRKYAAAYQEMGRHLGYTPEQLKKENIRFYSGRHFWKTFMNAKKLGEDIEEYFMGHSVSADVRENYNHKDKQGRKNLLEKVKKIIHFLDKWIFN